MKLIIGWTVQDFSQKTHGARVWSADIQPVDGHNQDTVIPTTRDVVMLDFAASGAIP
jgi:hypothetical protein